MADVPGQTVDNNVANLAVVLMALLVGLVLMLCFMVCAWMYLCGNRRRSCDHCRVTAFQRQVQHPASSSDHPLLASDSGIEADPLAAVHISTDLPCSVCISPDEDERWRPLNQRSVYGDRLGTATAPPPNKTINDTIIAKYEAVNNAPPSYEMVVHDNVHSNSSSSNQSKDVRQQKPPTLPNYGIVTSVQSSKDPPSYVECVAKQCCDHSTEAVCDTDCNALPDS